MSSSEESSSGEEDNTVYGKAKRQRRDAPAWKKQLTKELLKPKLKRFPRRRVFSPNVDRIWSGDLLDIHQYARVNKNYTFILVLVDVFSKYAWAKPLKRKEGIEVARALEEVFTQRTPKKLWTDRGTEFYNVNVKNVLKRHNVELYSTHNEPKSVIAERFIRTLRGKIESNYILTQSTVWYDILPELIREYNTTYHHSIKMTPEEASKPYNQQKVYNSLYSKIEKVQQLPSFHIGDKVRISVSKRLFEKGSTSNWSEEIFEISDVVRTTTPIVYKIKDLADEEIEGSFYKEQLQKTNQTIYRIDRVIRKRRKPDGTQEVLVKWAGYEDRFNSWMPSDDIMRSGAALQNI